MLREKANNSDLAGNALTESALKNTNIKVQTKRTPMQPNKSLIAVLAGSLALSAAQAAVVYDNATTYTGNIFNPGASEVGDEVILGGTDRVGETFRFEYYGNNFSGNETVQIRFYQNDGPLYPNTVFFDSGVQTLPIPLDPSGRNTLQYDLLGSNITLPDDFTWSVQFVGVTSGETAGLSLYNPPTTGNNYDDYWLYNGSAWVLSAATNGTPINFGASITAIPEPSSYMLAILGGLCGFALVSRRPRSAKK